MLIVKTNDGIEFVGDDAAAIVRQMRDTQWGAPVLKRDYMIEVAERLAGSTTQIVANAGPEAFLLSLKDNEIVTVENTDGITLDAAAPQFWQCLYCRETLPPNTECTRTQCVDAQNAARRRMGFESDARD